MLHRIKHFRQCFDRDGKINVVNWVLYRRYKRYQRRIRDIKLNNKSRSPAHSRTKSTILSQIDKYNRSRRWNGVYHDTVCISLVSNICCGIKINRPKIKQSSDGFAFVEAGDRGASKTSGGSVDATFWDRSFWLSCTISTETLEVLSLNCIHSKCGQSKIFSTGGENIIPVKLDFLVCMY